MSIPASCLTMSSTSFFVFLLFSVTLAWGTGLEEKDGTGTSRFFRTGIPQDGGSNIRNGPLKVKSFGNQPKYTNNDGNQLRMGNYYLPAAFDPNLMTNVNRPQGVYEPPIIATILGPVYEPPAMPNLYAPPAIAPIYDSPLMGSPHTPAGTGHLFSPTGLSHMVASPVLGHMYEATIPIPSNVHEPPGMPHVYSTTLLGPVPVGGLTPPLVGPDPPMMEQVNRPPTPNQYEPPVIGHMYDPAFGPAHEPPPIVFPGNKPYGPPVPGRLHDHPGYILQTSRLAPPMEMPNLMQMLGPVAPAQLPEQEQPGNLYSRQPPLEHMSPQPLINDIYSSPMLQNPHDSLMMGGNFDHHVPSGINNVPQSDMMSNTLTQAQALPQPPTDYQCIKTVVPSPITNSQDTRQMGYLVKLVRVLLGGRHRGSDSETTAEAHHSKEDSCNFRSSTLEIGEGGSEESPDSRKKPVRKGIPLLREH